MKQQLLHQGALVLLPLLVGALLGGVKWKQLHPTPTQLDLQERARLMKAKRVELRMDGHTVVLPVDEFKATLKDFYLVELKPTHEIMLMGSRYRVITAPIVSLSIVKYPNPCMSLAEIELANPNFYMGHKTKNGCGDQLNSTQIVKSLHPVTLRRLNELIAKHLPAH